jgi:hypothetical protein
VREKNDIKIFILYLMRNIGYPLEFTELNDVVMRDGVVGYFDFVMCLGELVDSKNIEKIRDENGTELYSITAQGIRVSDTLESEIGISIREKSLKSAMRMLDFKKKGIKSGCTSSVLPDGRFLFECYISERGQDTVRVSLTVDNKRTPDRMIYNFDNNPEGVYKGLLSVMTGELDYLMGK